MGKFIAFIILFLGIQVSAEKFEWKNLATQFALDKKPTHPELIAFINQTERIDATKSLTPLFKPEGWKYRGIFNAEPTRIGDAVYIPMVLNQSHGTFKDGNLKFERSTKVFTLYLEISGKLVTDMKILSCENEPNSFDMSFERHNLDEEEFKKSLPNIVTLGVKVMSVGVDSVVLDSALFLETAFNMEVTKEESLLSKQYGAWYYPYHLSVIKDKGPFKSLCTPGLNAYKSETRNALGSLF